MIAKLIVALILPLMNLFALSMVKHVLKQYQPAKELSGIDFALHMLSIPSIWLIAAFQFGSFVLWGFVISKLELGIANALAGSFYYLFSALVGMLVFGEFLSMRDWCGIVLISSGAVVLLSKNVI